jgi:uroporphyrinogen-III synthase
LVNGLMHILVTRPKDDADEIKIRLVALGHKVSLAPLLDIEFEPIEATALSDATAIIATSRNGLRALRASPVCAEARKLVLFAVGPATAQLARELGFIDIIAGPGTAAELIPLVVAHPAAREGTLYHAAGDRLAFDLTSALSAHDIRLKMLPAYRSAAAKTLPSQIVADLTDSQIDAVILMSPRTAETWGSLVTKLPAKTGLTSLVHVCLSPAVTQALLQAFPKDRPAPRIEVAAAPNVEEILALVCRLAANSGSG